MTPTTCLRAASAAVLIALLTSFTTDAAIITVDDSSDVSGSNCTLRDAIAAANSDSVVSGCAAGSGLDTINFSASILPATITLGGTELTITTPLNMLGPGPDQLTISGDMASRIFSIDDGLFDGTVQTISIAGVTLINGNTSDEGGAIFNAEQTTLSNCVLSGNRATGRGGAIMNGKFRNLHVADLTVIDCVFSSNSSDNAGGHIASVSSGQASDGSLDGRLTIAASTFANGSASDGGAVSVAGPTSITNTSFTQNTATIGGGGLFALFEASTTVSGSTFSANSADVGGAIRNSFSELNLTNSTVSGNQARLNAGLSLGNETSGTFLHNTVINNVATQAGGGLSSSQAATLSLYGNILANNSPDDCRHGSANAVADSANNVIEVEGPNCGTGPTDVLSVDPVVGPLADNGGPTSTHGLLPGSPAIDAGDTSNCAGLITDQTGMTRSVDGDSDGSAVCDIGAFEFVDLFGPLPTLANAPTVRATGAASYVFDIAYFDEAGVDPSSIDTADVMVTGPSGALSVTAASANTDASLVSYTVIPPGGNWDLGENGDNFTVAVVAGQVFDLATAGPTASEPQTLGSFTVGIHEIDLRGNDQSIANGDSSPSAADHTAFGGVAVGQSFSRVFTIHNTALGTLNITGAITSSNPDFEIVQPTVTPIAAASSSSFEVRMVPTAEGSSSATLTIPNDDSDEAPYTFDVAGTGLVPDLQVLGNGMQIVDGDSTPMANDDTDFGNVGLLESVSRTYTLQNTGDAVLTISDVVASGFGRFVASPPATLVVQPGQSTTFDVTFTPQIERIETGTVFVTSDDPDEATYNFAVSGRGVGAEIAVTGLGMDIIDGATAISVDDDTDFGEVGVFTSATRTFTITNQGLATLTLTDPIDAFIEFDIVQPAEASLAPGASTTFDVIFTPTAIDPVNRPIVIATNDSDERFFTFTVGGRGAPPVAAISGNMQLIANGDSTPSALDGSDFGDINVGTTSSRTFTIVNTGLGVLSLDPLQSDNSAFTVIQPTLTALQPNQSTTFEVRVGLSSANEASAVISLVSSDTAASPYTFTVRANGVGPREDRLFSDGFE